MIQTALRKLIPHQLAIVDIRYIQRIVHYDEPHREGETGARRRAQ